MKQTAVEWLVEEMILRLSIRIENTFEVNDLLIKAKEMEKEQIIDAFDTGRRKGDWIFDGEKYYEETYKNEAK
jgi:ACT domain-containing protein